ncbi:MAG TPA: fibronectin type III domain-containing protein, partial [Acidimicrobiia bacterium]|nr:fibronectin type III domain-containing protein [Acidimicrobiia bacterium]
SASFDSFRRVSGTAQDGVYEGEVRMPQHSAQGLWIIDSVQLRDAVGNSRFLTNSDLQAAGFPTSFEQSGPGDTTAPVLAELSIAPTTIDTSTQSRLVIVRARITDALSGNGYSSASFRGPTGQWTSASFDSFRRVSGTAQDGVYEGEVRMPQHSAQGLWIIDSVQMRDAVGNSRFLTNSDLQAAGFPTSFEVSPPPPSPPSAPRTLTAAATPNDVTLTWSPPASNNGAPISGYRVYRNDALLASPGSDTLTYVDSAVVVGDLHTYAVRAVNSYGEGPASNSVQVLIGGSPPSDTTAPDISELSFTPSVVDASSEAQRITVRARITDGVSGHRWGSATFRSPSGSASLWASFDDWSRVSGTAQDGVYESIVRVPQHAEQGTWTLTSLNLQDAGGSSRWLTTADLTTRGLPTTFVVGSRPSEPQNLVATPGAGVIALGWDAPGSDGGSALTGYKVFADGALVATLDSATTTYDHAGLGEGESHTYAVRALNALGEGATSAEASATTFSRPSEPQNLVAAPGAGVIGEIRLEWERPSREGGLPLLEYVIARDGAPIATVDGDTLEFTDDGLTPGTTYEYTVAARNALGDGAPSLPARMKPSPWVPELCSVPGTCAGTTLLMR